MSTDKDQDNLLDPRNPHSPYNRHNWNSPYSDRNPKSPHYVPQDGDGAAELVSMAVMAVVAVILVIKVLTGI